MRHSKQEACPPEPTGTFLMCGKTKIAFSQNLLTNWHIGSCPICGMEVQTTGHSTATDLVQEFVDAGVC